MTTAQTRPYVVVINETLAQKYFSGKDPLGQQIDLGGKETGAVKAYTIVGVIGDQVDAAVSQSPRPLLMVPYEQVPATSLYYQLLIKTVVFFAVKTRGNIAVAPEMRNVFKQTAPDFALDNFQTMQQAVDGNNFSQRLGLYLTGAFAGMAVLMVIAGLYGVLAQLVSYRRREIGVRLALGSTRERILRMFLKRGLILVVAGLVLGMACCLVGRETGQELPLSGAAAGWLDLCRRRGPSACGGDAGGIDPGAARSFSGADRSAQGRVKISKTNVLCSGARVVVYPVRKRRRHAYDQPLRRIKTCSLFRY